MSCLLIIIYSSMSKIYFNLPMTPPSQPERGFKKLSGNQAYDASPPQLPPAKLPTYTYRTIDETTGKSKDNNTPTPPIPNIETPQINTNKYTPSKQITNNTLQNTTPIQQTDKSTPTYGTNTRPQESNSFLYEDIKRYNAQYEASSKEQENSKIETESQTQKYFSKYAKGQKSALGRTKSNSDILPKDISLGSYNTQDYYNRQYNSGQYKTSEVNSVREANSLSFSAADYLPKIPAALYNTGVDTQDYKFKVIKLERQLTQNSLQKGQLIIQLAQVSRLNRELRQQIERLKEIQLAAAVIPTPLPPPVKKEGIIQIDEQLVRQILNIKQMQNQINKTKEEFMQLVYRGYQSELKRLLDKTNSLKLQLQAVKIELAIANDDIKEKQIRIQFLQKQFNALQLKSRNFNKITNTSSEPKSEKENEIIALRHSLNSLEARFKAQAKQLADKEDFILKYLLVRGGGQDLQVIQQFANQKNSYSGRVDELSQVMSIHMKNSL